MIKIMELIHLMNVHIDFYLKVNQLITDKTQNIFI